MSQAVEALAEIIVEADSLLGSERRTPELVGAIVEDDKGASFNKADVRSAREDLVRACYEQSAELARKALALRGDTDTRIVLAMGAERLRAYARALAGDLDREIASLEIGRKGGRPSKARTADVLRLLQDGRNPKEIARRLGVDVRTIQRKTTKP